MKHTIIAAASIATAVVIGLSACGSSWAENSTSREVSRSDAEDYIAELTPDALTVMDTQEVAGFCSKWADDQAFCTRSLEVWAGGGSIPLVDNSIAFSYHRSASGTYIVRIEAESSDGHSIVSDIEVVRAGSSTRAVDPVFWVPRTIHE